MTVGDIVLVDDGMPYHAEVIEPPVGRRVRVEALSGKQAPRTVRSTWITGHWRKSGRRRGRDGQED